MPAWLGTRTAAFPRPDSIRLFILSPSITNPGFAGAVVAEGLDGLFVAAGGFFVVNEMPTAREVGGMGQRSPTMTG